jgi:hypothetical protein
VRENSNVERVEMFRRRRTHHDSQLTLRIDFETLETTAFGGGKEDCTTSLVAIKEVGGMGLSFDKGIGS